MFFRSFNSLLGSVGANFSHVVLNIIIVKHKQSLFLWTVRWIGATISLKNAYHKTQYTKWNKLCHDERLLNINTARLYTTVLRKSTVYNTVTFNTAIFFLYRYTAHPLSDAADRLISTNTARFPESSIRTVSATTLRMAVAVEWLVWKAGWRSGSRLFSVTSYFATRHSSKQLGDDRLCALIFILSSEFNCSCVVNQVVVEMFSIGTLCCENWWDAN